MTPTPFPTVATWPLPPQVQHLPERAAPAEAIPADSSPGSADYDPEALCEAIAPMISAAIARRARQRRYT